MLTAGRKKLQWTFNVHKLRGKLQSGRSKIVWNAYGDTLGETTFVPKGDWTSRVLQLGQLLLESCNLVAGGLHEFLSTLLR